MTLVLLVTINILSLIFNLHCTVLYCTLLYYCYLAQGSSYVGCTVLYCIVLFCPVLLCTVLHYSYLAQGSSWLYCTVLLWTVLHYNVNCYLVQDWSNICCTIAATSKIKKFTYASIFLQNGQESFKVFN